MSRRPVRLLAAILVAAAVPSAGCSQVAQLRGVAGAQVSAVRTATNDVLVTHDVGIRVAPVCAFTDPTYTCQGTAADGQPITSTATVRATYGATTDEWGAYQPADVALVVSVGGRPIYDGTVQDVLLRNGQARP